MRKRGGQLKYKIKINWNPNFAYAIGLITSDGCLSKDGRHISFVSKDQQQTKNFKEALGLDNKIIMSGRGSASQKQYYQVRFGDKNFYSFLCSIGLSPRKSKIIGSLAIPDNCFADFVRGEFDGDGSFYSTFDRRWPNSFTFYITFASASLNFIKWLQFNLNRLYGVKGIIWKGKGVYQIRYVKRDTIRLFEIMYSEKSLYLKRKYDRIKQALDLNKELKFPAHPVRNVFTLIQIMPS